MAKRTLADVRLRGRKAGKSAEDPDKEKDPAEGAEGEDKEKEAAGDDTGDDSGDGETGKEKDGKSKSKSKSEGDDQEKDAADDEGDDDEDETPMAEEDDKGQAARGRERARIAAILRHPDAQGRASTALSLALDTSLTSAEAVKVLATVEKGAGEKGAGEKGAAAGKKSLTERMAEESNPPTGPGGRAGAPKDHGWDAAVGEVNRKRGLGR